MVIQAKTTDDRIKLVKIQATCFLPLILLIIIKYKRPRLKTRPVGPVKVISLFGAWIKLDNKKVSISPIIGRVKTLLDQLKLLLINIFTAQPKSRSIVAK